MRNHFRSPYRTEIVTTDGSIYAEESMLELLNQACLQHGSNLRGRQEAVRHHTGYHKKIPLPITDHVCLFPTKSLKNLKTISISVDRIQAMRPQGRGTLFTFHNGHELYVDIGYDSMRLQYDRAICAQAKLGYKLSKWRPRS
ncbi:competence protein ComK [Ectobacillus ponti]|uniref:Competence protein ComK n=1 Tax=Ectobacillus ponti TaxID=2961894 RepID=A0AA41X634_9BACI|nr:competence protein ComK [Ectobacillus ponti]MCP8967863.1 competence protein ComK [Ectobacillus ponti]